MVLCVVIDSIWASVALPDLRPFCAQMRQPLTVADEPHLLIRALSVDYGPGRVTGSHTHPWPQLLYSQQGAIRADVDDSLWTVPPRRALWIPAGMPHRLTMLGEVKLRTLYHAPERSSSWRVPRIMSISGLLHETILRVCAQQWLDGRRAIDRLLADLIKAELDTADRVVMALRRPHDARALRLANRFCTEADAQIPLSRLYAAAGVSRRTAERLFSAETGLSPARWRRAALLSRAVEYLADGRTIDDTAALSGFRSRSAFSHAFRQAYGFGPGEARRDRSGRAAPKP